MVKSHPDVPNVTPWCDGWSHRGVMGSHTAVRWVVTPRCNGCSHRGAFATLCPGSQEVWADAADGASAEEAADRTCNERPDGLQSRLEHSRPVDFKFHVVFPFFDMSRVYKL